MDYLVDLAFNDPCAPTALLHGHKRATPQVREYFVIAAIASQPCELVVNALLDDDRFFMNGPDLQQKALNQIDIIAHYPQLIWDRMAIIVGNGTCAADLRHTCMYATLRGYAFMHMDCFDALTKLPYSLTQGDLVCKVQDIARQPEDKLIYEIPLKIKRGIDLGIAPDTYVHMLRHWKKSSCSNHQTENAHSLGAKLHQHHPQYYFEVMRDRSTAMGLSPYVVPTPLERQLDRLG